MRAYTLAMLEKLSGQGHPIVESGIIDWANNKVKTALKNKCVSYFFNDETIWILS